MLQRTSGKTVSVRGPRLKLLPANGRNIMGRLQDFFIKEFNRVLEGILDTWIRHLIVNDL